MNVLFVAQCTKRALCETRRILDQFAERRGDRTWQTPITQAGLDTVRKLLRASARKNTAVACHWIRGQDHSELLWVVGDGRQFNLSGAVPTHSTARNILRSEDESTWHHLPLMTALAALAALLHDLGKATEAFQERLRQPMARERNHYRHEWVSVRLFQAFVGAAKDDAQWLQRLSDCAEDGIDASAFEALWLDSATGRLLRDGIDAAAAQPSNAPFHSLPPLAQALAWLVLTHHRLPCKPVRAEANHSDGDAGEGHRRWQGFGTKPGSVEGWELDGVLAQINADWNEPREALAAAQVRAYWAFPHGLPVRGVGWRKQAARFARKLQTLSQTFLQPPSQAHQPMSDPFAMHVTRLCLMLADHHYSRQGLDKQGVAALARQPYLQPKALLAANTTVDFAGRRVINQSLDEHLLGVQAHASVVARSLPTLARSLPALLNHRGLKKRNAQDRYRWQDKATELAASVRQRAMEQGAFIVNMASTGCGKTLGNARIMNALADPALGLRCAFAMGLRVLTLQTGRSFQHDLGLNDEQLAIQVGGAASRALFEHWEQQAEQAGSASSQSLLDEGGQVLFEGNDRHPLLERLSDDSDVRSLLAASLLVCTVDHLTPATESLRGGRQIAPMLRLMTGDLVLDEPDDFDMADLPALTRLVHWAGLLGSRVLLSSATLPPALVEGLFLAYRAGRACYQTHRSPRPDEQLRICCLWVDEFHQATQDCALPEEFRTAHEAFAQRRVGQLAKAEVRRLARIAALPAQWSAPEMTQAARREDFARFVLAQAVELHRCTQNHSIDPVSGKRVSLGLIRMANIDPLYDVAQALFAQGASADGVRVHLCVYHSQFPLLARSAMERQLDTVLRRHPNAQGLDPVFTQPGLRALIDSHPEQDQLFVVLGSPVTEVGRDHDYDWAVVEPSSMRSLIQLAGRVRRHRPGSVTEVNVRVLDSNLRAFERPRKAAFCKPGFELDEIAHPTEAARYFHFQSHRLQKLLARQVDGLDAWPIDARPRVAIAKAEFHPGRNLADLEHARMRDTMLPRAADSKDSTPVIRAASLQWAHAQALWLTGLLPQYQRFRHDPVRRVDVAFLPDDEEDNDDNNALVLHRVVDDRSRANKLYVRVEDSLVQRLPDASLPGDSVTPWIHVDLLAELSALAQNKGMPLHRCAQRYATASLPDFREGWRWHAVLGFSKHP